MMCFTESNGVFPLTLEECECIGSLCSERISEMEENLESKDPHKYIFIKELSSKMNAMIKLMNVKSIKVSK